MSLPSLSQFFESQSTTQKTALKEMIRDKMQPLLSDRAIEIKGGQIQDSIEPTAVLTELGEYLMHTATMLADLADDLLKSPEMQSTINRANLELHQKANSHNNLADMTAVTSLDVSITRLRKMRNLSQIFGQDMQSIWRPSPAPGNSLAGLHIATSISPYHEGRPQFVPQHTPRTCNEELPMFRNGVVSPVVVCSDSSGSEDDDDDDQFSRIDMTALRQRGKGSYFCPKGHRCDKGGVDKSGNLVQFDRNSSFAQHCNKHRKPWRCDLAGCPNPPKKRKFARRDGLERHKQTVKHHITP